MRSQRLIAAAVAVALSGALAGCSSSMGNWDPTDLLDFLDTKKKLPGERKPVFPEGVPGLEQGVPKSLYKGSAQEQIDQQNAAAAQPVEEPKSKSRTKSKGKQSASTAPAAAPAAEAAPEEDGSTAAPPPAPKPKKIARRRTTAPPPDSIAATQPAAAAPQPAAQPQQAATPFPAPMPSGSFQR
jgi:hypothetical protein